MFKIKEWDQDTSERGLRSGTHRIPFAVVLPEWLPDSMVLVEPTGNIQMRVEYKLNT